MNIRLLLAAKLIADQLTELELERQRIASEGLATLEREDPETARLALQIFEDRRKAAEWLTHSVRLLENVTPWRCISEGNVERVRNVLNAIGYGDYL